MTLEGAENTSRSEGNMELAQQWIEDLKKSNARLSKVWPVLLVVAIILCVLYLYSQYQLSELETQKANEVKNMTSDRDAWLAKANDLDEKNKALVSELKALNEETVNLENTVSSELTEKDRLIEALQLKVTELETSALEATKSLVIAKKELIQLEQAKDRQLAELDAQYRSFKTEMNKQIESRKTAYNALVTRHKETKAEMDRLASLVDSKNSDLNRLKRDRDALRKNLIDTQKQLSQVRDDQQSLENKLSSLVSPITSQTSSTSSAASGTSSSATVDKGLAFKPITAPAPEPVKPSQKQEPAATKDTSALKFDSIAID